MIYSRGFLSEVSSLFSGNPVLYRNWSSAEKEGFCDSLKYAKTPPTNSYQMFDLLLKFMILSRSTTELRYSESQHYISNSAYDIEVC
jgi:hypothetical protein